LRIGTLPDFIRVIALDGVAVCFFDLGQTGALLDPQNDVVVSRHSSRPPTLQGKACAAIRRQISFGLMVFLFHFSSAEQR
jgi:hypothetical protein